MAMPCWQKVLKIPGKYLTGLLCISVLHGCIESRQGYYLSPNNSNSIPYHPVPLQSDSIHSALYINGGYYIGNANYFGYDHGFVQLNFGSYADGFQTGFSYRFYKK